jgi:hypothetical protein
VRLDARPPLKSPAPQKAADANPNNMVDRPEPIILNPKEEHYIFLGGKQDI